MNILDFTAEDLKGPVLDKSFTSVKKIFFERYKNYQPTVKDLEVPIDIDTFEGQVAMKDYLEIRVVEEIMEMKEAIENKDMREHIYEEVSDSFGFLINAYVLYGWEADKFLSVEKLWNEFNSTSNKSEDVDKVILQVVYDICLACNKLKIRPWKQSQYLTDMLIWEERLEKIYYSYMNLIFNLNIRPEMLWNIFNRKSQCNVFRLDTGY